MPTTYTHHRFGGECADTLGKEAAAAVVARRPLFDTGVHGPDLLFYYRAPLPTRVAKRGSALHRESARSFFEHARLVWNTRSDKEGMLAYLLGFLAHFALDSACHGFINSECARLGVTHNRLEAVWDARLMLRDGRRPSQVYRGEALKPDAANAAVIAPFYDLSDAEALSAMRGQARVMRLLRSPRGVKKRLLRAERVAAAEVICAAQQRLDLGGEDGEIKGLGDEVVRAHVHGHYNVHVVRGAGYEHHGHLRDLAYLGTPVIAVIEGQAYVQEHQLRFESVEFRHYIGKILRHAHLAAP